MGNCGLTQTDNQIHLDTLDQIHNLRQTWNLRPATRAESQHMFNMINSLSMAHFLKLYISVRNQPLHNNGDVAFRQCLDRVSSSRLG